MTGKWLRLSGVILLVMILPLSDPVHGQNPAHVNIELNVGFGPTSFLSVNQADAKAAFKVFTQSVGEKKGYNLDVNVLTFNNEEEFTTAVTNQSKHLVIMVAWDYFGSGPEDFLEPSFLAIESGSGAHEYLLIVSKDSPYRNFSDLRGKEITLLENTNCEMPQNWLETLLLEDDFGDIESFFANTVIESKPNKTLLPVFFGQMDACVVNRPVFEMICELNPQVGQRLHAIKVSEPLVGATTFLARDGWAKPSYRQDLIESLAALHQDPKGKQILTLFKSDYLVPFDETFMTGTRALKEKYDRLFVQRTAQ